MAVSFGLRLTKTASDGQHDPRGSVNLCDPAEPL